MMSSMVKQPNLNACHSLQYFLVLKMDLSATIIFNKCCVKHLAWVMENRNEGKEQEKGTKGKISGENWRTGMKGKISRASLALRVN